MAPPRGWAAGLIPLTARSRTEASDFLSQLTTLGERGLEFLTEFGLLLTTQGGETGALIPIGRANAVGLESGLRFRQSFFEEFRIASARTDEVLGRLGVGLELAERLLGLESAEPIVPSRKRVDPPGDDSECDGRQRRIRGEQRVPAAPVNGDSRMEIVPNLK